MGTYPSLGGPRLEFRSEVHPTAGFDFRLARLSASTLCFAPLFLGSSEESVFVAIGKVVSSVAGGQRALSEKVGFLMCENASVQGGRVSPGKQKSAPAEIWRCNQNQLLSFCPVRYWGISWQHPTRTGRAPHFAAPARWLSVLGRTRGARPRSDRFRRGQQSLKRSSI